MQNYEDLFGMGSVVDPYPLLDGNPVSAKDALKDVGYYGDADVSNKMGVGTAIGLGLEAASIIANLSMNYSNNRRNDERAEEAYQRSVAMWNKQTDYNSPANQIARLKQAGLNPNLLYGSPQNTASSAPEKKPASGSPGRIDSLQAMNALMLGKQMQSIDSQIKVQDAEANKLNVDAEHQEILNSDARDKIEREKQTWQSNLNEAKARIDKYYSDIGVNLYNKDNKDADTALKRLEYFFKFNTMGYDEEYKRSLNQVNWSKIARDAQEISLIIKKGEEIDVNIASRILHDYIDLGSDPYSADIGNVLYGSLVHGYDYDDATLERVIHAINEDEMKRHNAWKLVGLSAFSPLLNGFDRDLNVFTEKASKGKVNNDDLKKVIEALQKVPVKGKTFKGGPVQTLM